MNMEQLKQIGGLMSELKAQIPFASLFRWGAMFLFTAWLFGGGCHWLVVVLVVATMLAFVIYCIVFVVWALIAPLRLQSEPFQLQYKALELAEYLARSTKLRTTSAAEHR